jgi:hypothetical protein
MSEMGLYIWHRAYESEPQTHQAPGGGNPGGLVAAEDVDGRSDRQSRYRIWSVQNRSSRCSDLFRVANSSPVMPPTCSTVRTCFW